MSIQDYLRRKQIWFEVIRHERSDDAQHLAHAAHIPGKQVAKAVLVRVNGGYKYVAAILPATHAVDLGRLSRALGGAETHLASRSELVANCPDCDAAMMSPFASRYGLETLVDPAVAANEFIVVEGDGREEAIRMSYRDFYALEHPTLVGFAVEDDRSSRSPVQETSPSPQTWSNSPAG